MMRCELNPETGVIEVFDDEEMKTMKRPRTYEWGLLISKADFVSMKKALEQVAWRNERTSRSNSTRMDS
jgi:hypothetical protein